MPKGKLGVNSGGAGNDSPIVPNGVFYDTLEATHFSPFSELFYTLGRWVRQAAQFALGQITGVQVGAGLRAFEWGLKGLARSIPCLLYTSPSPRDQRGSRMPSSA